MSGITDLQTLIGSMEPVLKPGEYVFTTFYDIDWRQIADLQPISVFKENEGISLVIDRKTADEYDIPYDSVFRLISLHVHSSLDAVGLTAAFSGALGKAGISANVIAAYYHDHIFVPADKADQAVKVLEQLSIQNENK